MNRSQVLIVLFTFVAACALSQTHPHPALTTRQEFAKHNLLVSNHDFVGRSELTHYCLRIQPDGWFHRERGTSASLRPIAEVGKLSDSDVAELRLLLEDPEVRAYYQDSESFPKSIVVGEGSQIYEITVVRDALRPQDLFFICGSKSASPPLKFQRLQQLLRRYETTKSSAFRRVPADGCRANLASSRTFDASK